MKAAKAGCGVSPPHTGRDSPNPGLTGREHTWLQPVEEKRQRCGSHTGGRARGGGASTQMLPRHGQQVPRGPALAPKPVLHLTPHVPQVSGWSPSSFLFSPHLPPHRLTPRSRNSRLLPNLPIQPHHGQDASALPSPAICNTLAELLSNKSDHSNFAESPPPPPLPMSSPYRSPLLAHTPTGSSLHTLGYLAPACRGGPSS